MKQINVIDLDDTLINFDSMRYYLWYNINYKNIFYVFILSLLKFLNIISYNKYIFKCVIVFRKSNNYKDIILKLSNKIIESINKDVQKLIEINTNNETLNILCTASIDDYVLIVANHLGFEAICSTIQNNNFERMYGENKVKSITNIYPKNEFIYNFAISDSKSDLKLLKMFKSYELIEK